MQYLTDKSLLFNTLAKITGLIIAFVVLIGFSSAYWLDGENSELHSSLHVAETVSTGNYQLISKVPTSARYLTTDFLKFAYIITNNNEVIKYDSLGRAVAKYSNNRYGNLTSIDATSPFNVLLFYKDEATVVTVDMRLGKRMLFRLGEIQNMRNISAVCLSEDNYIWLFDANENKLKKVDHSYNIIKESIDLSTILGQRIAPTHMVERGGLVFVSVPRMGIIMFDVFGNYYSSVSNSEIGTNTIPQFQIVNRNMVFFEDGQMSIFRIGPNTKNRISIPNTLYTQDVKVEKGRLYILDRQELHFYKRVN